MACRLIWTEHAKQQREDLLLYGKDVWGIKQTRLFWKFIRSEIKKLSVSPYIGQRELLLSQIVPEIRYFILHPNYKLVYQYYPEINTIYILGLWDTRKNPRNNI